MTTTLPSDLTGVVMRRAGSFQNGEPAVDAFAPVILSGSARSKASQDLDKVKEFKLTELLTLKLEPVEQAYERGTTRRMESNIYVAGVKFRSCKYLLLNIDTSNKDLMHQQEDIDSIDEAAELLSTEMETDHSIIEPETEFWGHCSNLQVWCENDYDPRILHSSISLPLAVELIKQGEFKAKESLLKEIERRLKKTGFKAYKMFKSYFVYYTKEEMDVLREELMQSEFFIKSMMESKFKGYLKGGND